MHYSSDIPSGLLCRIKQNQDLVRVSIRQCNFVVRAYLPESDGRKTVEAYIHEVFRKRYGAHVVDFYPLLITIENCQGEIIAALGLRFASEHALVVEDYAHQNMSALLERNLHASGQRKNMIEVGNLASSHSGYAKFLFVAMTRILSDWHFQWLAFTAVPSVLNVFRKLKLNPVEVCDACHEDLQGSQSDWGDYYQHQPRVMLGDILSAHQYLEQQGSYQRIDFQWVEGNA